MFEEAIFKAVASEPEGAAATSAEEIQVRKRNGSGCARGMQKAPSLQVLVSERYALDSEEMPPQLPAAVSVVHVLKEWVETYRS